MALAALHNFIHLYDAEEGDLADYLNVDDHWSRGGNDESDNNEDSNVKELATNTPADVQRTTIAQAMWSDYQHVLQERYQERNDNDDDDGDDMD